LAELAERHRNGVIVVGPTDLDAATLTEIAAFAVRAGWPLIADPASGLRSISRPNGDALITTADLWPASANAEDVDVVVRVGLSVTSAAVQRRLDAATEANTVLVDPGTDWPDPQGHATEVIVGPVEGLFEVGELMISDDRRDQPWLQAWASMERRAAAEIAAMVATDDAELGAVAAVLEGATAAGASELVVASSMPIRVVDAVARSVPGGPRIRSNRGANGIDGVLATAMGVSVASGAPTVAVVGDVALVHDLGGLAAIARSGAQVTVVVLDNGGGGIFSMLPVRHTVDLEVFDRLFTTAPGVDAAAVAAALGIASAVVEVAELSDAVRNAVLADGPTLLRVPVGGAPTADVLAVLRSRIATGGPAATSLP